jgi:Holliday junction resolvase RusA-like endonuclease
MSQLLTYTKKIQFTVPGIPVAKGRPRFTTRGGYARAYTPKETTAYENKIKSVASSLIFGDTWKGPIRMELKIFKPMLKGFSKKRAALARELLLRPIVKPDCDNYGKIVSDALNRVIYKDDSQIVSANVEKYYSDEPRIEITLEHLTQCK